MAEEQKQLRSPRDWYEIVRAVRRSDEAREAAWAQYYEWEKQQTRRS